MNGFLIFLFILVIFGTGFGFEFWGCHSKWVVKRIVLSYLKGKGSVNLVHLETFESNLG